ncbi:MAG: O-antigen ligase family protein [Alphaproteobacteria bacterium]|nr:O-antigen ligase family protein [Alphaproteobacteria bacterium]
MPLPTANDVAAAAPPLDATWIDQAIFVAFLLLAFVGLSPFSPPPPAVAQFGGVATTGAGDIARQLCYLLVFAAVLIAAARRYRMQTMRLVPVLLVILLAWCVVSAAWSPEPAVTVRRAGLAAVLVVIAMLSVETLGAARAAALWRWILLAVLVVNIVSIRFVAQAVHLPGEADPQLVGDWRGLYGHKNIAGSVGAMTALIFLYAPRAKLWHKALDLVVVAAAVAFTVMTRSKSSLGMLVVATLAAALYRLAWRRDIDRLIAAVAAGAVVVAAVVVLISDQSVLLRFFASPDELTGRTAIWQAEVAYIIDHPLLGAGFGTFSDTGGLSPLHDYVGGWVVAASHGHNGYLQLLVTVGAVGFVLAFAALVAAPAMAFWDRCGDLGLKAMLFSLFVFLLLHNLMETDFLEGDGVAWVAYLLMLAMLYRLRREASP